MTTVDASGVEGVVGGFLLATPGSARAQIEELMRVCGVEAAQVDGVLRLRSVDRVRAVHEIDAVAEEDGGPLVERRRAEERDRPGELVLAYSDPARAYQPGVADAVRGEADRPRQEMVELPLTLGEDAARRLAAGLLRRLAGTGETASFALSPARLEVVPGDELRIAGEAGVWSVERIEDELMRRVEARRAAFAPALGDGGGRMPPAGPVSGGPAFPSRPLAAFLDLPTLGLLPDGEGPRVALAARPFVPCEVLVSRGGGDMRPRLRVSQPAAMGRLVEPLGAGGESCLDRTNRILVDLAGGALQSIDAARLLAGANLAAVESAEGRWEVLQFREAEEVAPNRFRLAGLVRGRGATGGSAAAAGARFVLLDERCVPVPLAESETGAALDWLVAPAGRALDDGAVVRETLALGRRALLPLAPVHLRARRQAGGLSVRWIRRSRAPLDPFDEEIALGEATERYRVRLLTPGGREMVVETTTPARVVAREEIEAGLGAEASGRLAVSVAQIGAAVGPGEARTVEVGAA
ncbi:phage tail protein [Aureimonas sp. AU4]|uniref:phage tail protein n=1 Tax=Aureimonas sp. AU4 TaxID=1638163 RepID=UPI00244E8DEF|nr:phage tail protein [Aureimonas sp. AU4]